MSRGSFAAVILAGGASSRMGADKALLPLPDGTTPLELMIALLRPLARTTLVVGRPAGGVAAGATGIPDRFPGSGPLGGVATGLMAAESEWVIVVAVDLPLLRPEVLCRMASLRFEADAVVPLIGGHAEPLVALYRRSLQTRAIAKLESGERRVSALADAVRTRWVPGEELRAVDPALQSFTNLNSPSDWERIASALDRRSGEMPGPLASGAEDCGILH